MTGSIIHLIFHLKLICLFLSLHENPRSREMLPHALAWPSNLLCIFPVVLFHYCFSSPTPIFSGLNLHLTSSSPGYVSRGRSLPGADAAQTIDPLPLAVWLWLHKTANKMERAGQLIMGISSTLYSFMRWRRKCLRMKLLALFLSPAACSWGWQIFRSCRLKG